jgi:hypothetical protein
MVSDTRLAWRGLGDPALILELKLQLFDQLRQPLAREGVGRLQGQPARLRQLPIEFCVVPAVHIDAPAPADGGTSKMFTNSFTRR